MQDDLLETRAVLLKALGKAAECVRPETTTAYLARLVCALLDEQRSRRKMGHLRVKSGPF